MCTPWALASNCPSLAATSCPMPADVDRLNLLGLGGRDRRPRQQRPCTMPVHSRNHFWQEASHRMASWSSFTSPPTGTMDTPGLGRLGSEPPPAFPGGARLLASGVLPTPPTAVWRKTGLIPTAAAGEPEWGSWGKAVGTGGFKGFPHPHHQGQRKPGSDQGRDLCWEAGWGALTRSRRGEGPKGAPGWAKRWGREGGPAPLWEAVPWWVRSWGQIPHWAWHHLPTRWAKVLTQRLVEGVGWENSCYLGVDSQGPGGMLKAGPMGLGGKGVAVDEEVEDFPPPPVP